MRTTAPGRSAALPHALAVTKVPFVAPRSRITWPAPEASTTAWRRETAGLSSAMSAPARPIVTTGRPPSG